MFYICTNFIKSFIPRLMLKERVFLFLFTVLLASGFQAQRHELGLRLGMSNLVGDIGRTNYFLQKPFGGSFSQNGIPFYGGLIYRMNFNPYQTLRFDLGFSHIQFNDSYAKEEYRRMRGLKGTNSGMEADVLFEYNFFPVNDEQKSMLSPYVFGGFGTLFYNSARITFVNDFNRVNGTPVVPATDNDFVTTAETSSANKMVMAVPFGAGLKYKFNYNWAISGELMFKPTFSDGIDYSTIDNKDIRLTYNKDITQNAGSTKSYLHQEPYITVAKQRAADYMANINVGNIHSKDWVNSVTLSLTYSFGRPACYCD